MYKVSEVSGEILDLDLVNGLEKDVGRVRHFINDRKPMLVVGSADKVKLS